jgi:hypothetical protein
METREFAVRITFDTEKLKPYQVARALDKILLAAPKVLGISSIGPCTELQKRWWQYKGGHADNVD